MTPSFVSAALTSPLNSKFTFQLFLSLSWMYNNNNFQMSLTQSQIPNLVYYSLPHLFSWHLQLFNYSHTKLQSDPWLFSLHL